MNLTADVNKLELIRSNRGKKRKLQNGASLISYANEKSKIIAQSSAVDGDVGISAPDPQNELEDVQKPSDSSQREELASASSTQPSHSTCPTSQIRRDYFTLGEIRKLSLLHNVSFPPNNISVFAYFLNQLVLSSRLAFSCDITVHHPLCLYSFFASTG